MTGPLRVGIIGCGLIRRKRADALAGDVLVGCVDSDAGRAELLASEHDAAACPSSAALLELAPDVVIVSTTHDALAPLACEALQQARTCSSRSLPAEAPPM